MKKKTSTQIELSPRLESQIKKIFFVVLGISLVILVGFIAIRIRNNRTIRENNILIQKRFEEQSQKSIKDFDKRQEESKAEFDEMQQKSLEEFSNF